MNTHYIFVHGWGTGPDFWNEMRAYFSEQRSLFLNLGFVGPDKRNENHKAPDKAKRIYITHSLGTLWALKNKCPDIDVLIAVNGFYRFKHFTDERSLQAMRLRLKRDPIPQMGSFWKKCGILDDNPALNLQRLQEGMIWLSELSGAKELSTLSGPVLCLNGNNDPILNSDLMKKEWSGFPIKTLIRGGHIMPWTHPEWCAEKINGLPSKRLSASYRFTDESRLRCI